jgi:hypothetical protein
MVNSFGVLKVFRNTVIFIGVPVSPLKRDTASGSVISRVDSSSILIILSPGLIPTLKAGVPSIGDTTVRTPSRMLISIPNPPNFPVVSSCISL